MGGVGSERSILDRRRWVRMIGVVTCLSITLCFLLKALSCTDESNNLHYI